MQNRNYIYKNIFILLIILADNIILHLLNLIIL